LGLRPSTSPDKVINTDHLTEDKAEGKGIEQVDGDTEQVKGQNETSDSSKTSPWNWSGVACALLRRMGGMGLDCHLFLMDRKKLDLKGLTPFYKSVLKSWTLLNYCRDSNHTHPPWLKEEPLFFIPALEVDIHKSVSLRNALVAANIAKVGHLASEDGWVSAETLAVKLGIRSVQVAQKLLTQVLERPPQDQSFPEHIRQRGRHLLPRAEGSPSLPLGS
ncbi:NACHT, LRR and PYD domains-containing protein 3-like, partial [Tachysurus ichikawai]